MSVPSLRRLIIAAALLFSAQAIFAANPSARTGVRMAFEEATGNTILFGGLTDPDAGTVQSYEPTDTWLWNGLRWLQRYPEHHPTGRSSHVMVYDPVHERIVLFGGRSGTTELADTWFYEHNDWTQVTTPIAPPERSLAAAAFDPVRNKIVLFGGNKTTTDAKGVQTTTQYYDTWEFDGTEKKWSRLNENGPQIIRPNLAFDESRNQLLLVGEDAEFKPLMYVFDPAASTWTELKPEKMPPCVNQSVMTYQRAKGDVLLAGGVCVITDYSSPSTEEAWSWDGTTWTSVATKSVIIRTTNAAIAYDTVRNVSLLYGGTEAYGSPRSATYTFDSTIIDTENDPPTFTADWTPFDTNSGVPGPRSLAAIDSDPANKIIYLLNGLTDGSFYSDFWAYQNGGWSKIVAENTPGCGTPFAAFDTDRSRLVVMCNDASTFEWDGTAWTTFDNLKTRPAFRRFAAMAYDKTLKRTVLYGGWDEANYVNTTWLWDGTTWTEQKKNRAPSRALPVMWFDPILNKTVLYGGIGRPRPEDRLQRYNDMWSLDGNGWTQIKPPALPPTRYGAQVAVDPNTKHTILFGGLRLDVDDKGLQKQVYANDMWEWDGATWKALTTTNVPPPRENASMEYDFGSNSFLLFGGWSGFYLADTWVLEGNTWRAVSESLGRRRSIGRR